MSREIASVVTGVAPVDPPVGDDVRAWLASQMRAHTLRWLLAYADDGVIWGELRGTQLATSDQAFPARAPVGTLRAQTLQRAHAFGAGAELLLRRDDTGWRASLRRDGSGAPTSYYDERYLLWGTTAGTISDGFVELTEGARGIRHTPPTVATPVGSQRGALLVRHYLNEDPESGLLRVSARRLVDLQGAK